MRIRGWRFADQWFHALFQALPELICPLLDSQSVGGGAQVGAASASAARRAASAPGREPAYRFSSPELKSGSHRLDGLLWPQGSAGGSDLWPVVILEVQMHPDRGFHHRLAAETFRFLQQHPQVEHLRVVVLLALLTLPVQPEPDLGPCCQRILAAWPELLELILPMLAERFARLTDTEILAMIGIPVENYRHTRLAQGLLQEGLEQGLEKGLRRGLEQGRQAEAAALCLRLLRRRCGELPPATTARIEALELDQLEALADSLLDFNDAADLQRWLDR